MSIDKNEIMPFIKKNESGNHVTQNRDLKKSHFFSQDLDLNKFSLYIYNI